jgi:subtilisin family serine protease
MDERDYVVIDVDLAHTRDAETPDLGMSRGPMTQSEALDQRRQPGRFVAETMPLKLIEPFEEPDVTPSAGVTWGVEAVGALDSTLTGAGITVAVLDTGIEAGHPAFAGIEIVERDFTGSGDGDTHGHGTHCAGTIAGRDVDGTRFGVAQGVTRLLAGKVLGGEGGGTDTIAAAIQWAVDEGAHVISMSLGIDFPGFVRRLQDAGWATEPATSRALAAYRDNLRLLEALASFVTARFEFGRSAILVAAAGNESERTAPDPYTIDVAPPAASLGFVSVAALGQAGTDLEVASFSNTGATLAGPGVGVTSAGLGGGLQTMSGTSMATPHVAGVAALWAERLLTDTGTVDPDLLGDRLVGNARSLTGLSFADGGAGLVRAPG